MLVRIRIVLLGLLIIIMAAGVTGCRSTTPSNSSLELYKYPNVLLPVPDKVTLTREKDGDKQEVALKKGDLGSLMKVLRIAVDTTLKSEKLPNNAWDTDRNFSLELTYEQKQTLILQTDRPVELQTKKLLIKLDKGLILVDTKNGLRGFSGLQFTDSFLKFMKEYNADAGFPLPPAKKGDVDIQQLPLAEPGQAKVELLPPSKPRTNGYGVH